MRTFPQIPQPKSFCKVLKSRLVPSLTLVNAMDPLIQYGKACFTQCCCKLFLQSVFCMIQNRQRLYQLVSAYQESEI